MTDPIYQGLKRTPGWRKRFAEVMIIDPTRKFNWGNNDCITGLVAPAIFAMTEFDIISDIRGKYSDVGNAWKTLRGLGFTNLGDAAAAYFKEIPVSYAHIGDIVTIPSDLSAQDGLGISLGVVNGERVTVLSYEGLATVPMSMATRAFRVG